MRSVSHSLYGTGFSLCASMGAAARSLAAGRNLLCPRRVLQEGDCFAKAHLSTAEATSRKNARIPRAHEESGRPQGACGAPPEGPPSAHTRVAPREPARRGVFRERRGWCDAETLMLCTAPGSAARAHTSPFFFARTTCRKAASASALKKRWEARWCAIASGGACERSCAAIVGRSRRDGTSSYIRRAAWRGGSSRRWRRICCGRFEASDVCEQA